MDGFQELLECGNGVIADAAMKCEAVFASHNKAYVGISGGADSDVMMDLCERVRRAQPIDIHYEFTDTGIEYEATKEHLSYLMDRYDVRIRIAPPDRTIPVTAKTYGLPFISKMVSHQIERLQKGGFEWVDGSLASLKLRYPKIPESTLKWWTNEYASKHGSYNSYCIGRNKWLKEFLMTSPPTFPITDKCCAHAKKTPSMRSARVRGCDVSMSGVRKAEGGIRSAVHKCVSRKHGMDQYKPLFWMKNEDRAFYDERFGMEHSECYTVWGFTRTGCVGCPFNRNVVKELAISEEYEPRIVNAARKVFRKSLDYTNQYHEYREWKESGDGQPTLF